MNKHRPFAECSAVSKFIAMCFSLPAIEQARHVADIEGRLADFSTLSDAMWMRSSLVPIDEMERLSATNPSWPLKSERGIKEDVG